MVDDSTTPDPNPIPTVVMDPPTETIHNIPLPGGDSWPTSPSPQMFEKGWSKDKRRRVNGPTLVPDNDPVCRMLELYVWPPLHSLNKAQGSWSIPDLNCTVSNHDRSSSNSILSGGPSSNDVSSLLKVDGEVGFQIYPKEPIVAEIVNDGAPIAGIEDGNDGGRKNGVGGSETIQ
ncbi:hypothetical protein L2E82_49186 [Cichorium intybus]|uniref:Uncharacterized protein n=1 Tax=Cichorium intybus TaxID=13427 RepID=A0ACB8Z027_CICIN|nr:hypothetical protein L2E82_49186 [Cichorium intybus]